MNNTFISFVAPFYNVNLYLGEFLDSFVHLDKTKYELILVDDCGEDADEIINGFTEVLNIKIIRNKTNIGLGSSRNVGVKNISSESTHVIFVDTDDRLASEFHIGDMSREKINYYKMRSFDMNNISLAEWNNNGYYSAHKLKGFIWGIAFPVEIIRKFPFDRREWEDMVVMAKLAKEYYDSFELVDIPCVEYRMRKSSISGAGITTRRKNEGYYNAFKFVVKNDLISHNRNRYIGRFIESQYLLPKGIRIIEKDMLNYPNWKRKLRHLAILFQKLFYFNLNDKNNFFE